MPDPVSLRARSLAVLCFCVLIAMSAVARPARLSEDAAVNYLHAAAAHLQADDLDAAASVLEEALQRAAASPELLTLLSQVHQRQGNLERAANLAEEALGMQPSFAPAHLQLGDVYRELGWLESACERYRDAVAADANAPAARERLVRTLLAAGRPDEAASQCRDFLAEEPSSALQAALGDVLQARGDLRGAATAYRQALAQHGRNAIAHCGLAEVLLARGQVDEAAASARQALAIAPELARAHACLSRSCVQSDDYLGAYGHAVKAEQSGLDMSEIWVFLQGDQ